MRFTNLPDRAAQYVGAAPAAPALHEHAEQRSAAAPGALAAVMQAHHFAGDIDIDALGLCSVERAGQLIGIDASLVRRYARQGAIPAVRVDGVWVLLERDALAFKARPRRKGRPARS